MATAHFRRSQSTLRLPLLCVLSLGKGGHVLKERGTDGDCEALQIQGHAHHLKVAARKDPAQKFLR